MKSITKLAANLQIQRADLAIGSDSSAVATQSGAIGNEATDYQRKATLYAYSQLQSVYGPKFRSTFKSEEELKVSRRQWAKNFGTLERHQIDEGIERLKLELEASNPRFEWPDIGRFIGLCKRKEAGEIEPYKHPWEEDGTPELPPRDKRAAIARAHIRRVRRRLKAKKFKPKT